MAGLTPEEQEKNRRRAAKYSGPLRFLIHLLPSFLYGVGDHFHSEGLKDMGAELFQEQVQDATLESFTRLPSLPNVTMPKSSSGLTKQKAENSRSPDRKAQE